MGFVELFLLALGLSMDAFAVSVCIGLNMQKEMLKKALIVGLYFGIFQAVMPLIGYFAARLFSNYITSYDHWIAFALLVFLGFRMISKDFRG
jgi:putative Mn2+ efflux pump MntP